MRENYLRQHFQLLANPNGSVHEEAVREMAADVFDPEEEADKNLSVPSLASPHGGGGGGGHINIENSSIVSEDHLDSLLQHSESTQLLSVSCHKVLLSYALPGTLVLTKSSMAFTADDSAIEYEKVQCLVSE